MTDRTQGADAFMVRRLRRKPIEYTVTISHFVSGGTWVMGVSVRGVSEMDEVQRDRIATDLRHAADLVETAEWEVVGSGS